MTRIGSLLTLYTPIIGQTATGIYKLTSPERLHGFGPIAGRDKIRLYIVGRRRQVIHCLFHMSNVNVHFIFSLVSLFSLSPKTITFSFYTTTTNICYISIMQLFTIVIVSAHWGMWSAWNTCSGDCTTAVQTRTRLCSGDSCPSSNQQTKKCVPFVQNEGSQYL